MPRRLRTDVTNLRGILFREKEACVRLERENCILCCLYSLNSVATAVLELRLAAKEIYKARTSIAQFENQRYCLEICCQLYTAYPWEKEVFVFFLKKALDKICLSLYS